MHGSKELLAQFMRFKQVAEAQDGGCVGNGFLPEVDADKPAHDGGVIQRFFHPGVGEVEPVLQFAEVP